MPYLTSQLEIPVDNGQEEQTPSSAQLLHQGLLGLTI